MTTATHSTYMNMHDIVESETLRKYLRPYVTEHRLERFGPNGEFGYVVPGDIWRNAKRMLSCGVGDNCDFENAVLAANPKMVAVAFDGTVQGLPANADKALKFVRRNIGVAYDRRNVSLEDWAVPGTVVKMDIEGFEFPSLMSMPDYVLSDMVDSLVLEIHTNVKFGDDPVTTLHNGVELAGLLKRIERCMTLVHVHGNNIGPAYSPCDADVPVPGLLEVTFVANRLVNSKSPSNERYPIGGLDYPNSPSLPDHDLSWLTR